MIANQWAEFFYFLSEAQKQFKIAFESLWKWKTVLKWNCWSLWWQETLLKNRWHYNHQSLGKLRNIGIFKKRKKWKPTFLMTVLEENCVTLGEKLPESSSVAVRSKTAEFGRRLLFVKVWYFFKAFSHC